MTDPNPNNDTVEGTVTFLGALATGFSTAIQTAQQNAAAQGLNQLESNRAVLTDLANFLKNNIDDIAQPFINQANTRNGQLIIDYVSRLKLGADSILNTINTGLLTEEKLLQGIAQANRYASLANLGGVAATGFGVLFQLAEDDTTGAVVKYYLRWWD